MKKFDPDIARAGGYSMPFMGAMPLLVAIALTIVWWTMVSQKCDAYLLQNPDGACFLIYTASFVVMTAFWVGFYYLMKSITKPVWDAHEKILELERLEKEKESRTERENNSL